jgi:amidase
MLPLAPGSDGAGSIRIPASFSGLVGHKPTRDLVPNPHARFDALGLSVIGPLARNVDDAATLLDVLTRRRHHDEGFAARARVPPRPLVIRFTTASPVIDVDPPIVEVVHRVARVLEGLGHHVEEGPGVEGTIEDFLPMFQFLVKNTPVPFERWLQPLTRWLRETGAGVSAVDAMVQRELFRENAKRWFGDADVWLTPTVGKPAPKIGQWKDLEPRELVSAAAPLGAFTAAFNASGQPATNLPVWPEGGGAPIGVQLVGRHGDDALLLALARSIMMEMGTAAGRIAPS